MKINKINVLTFIIVLSACKFDNKYIVTSHDNDIIKVEKNIDA